MAQDLSTFANNVRKQRWKRITKRPAAVENIVVRRRNLSHRQF
jgi:hypothetical protein